jgi:hypothetical protein
MSNEPGANIRLPGIAFATLPITGETIAIRHGERLYYRVNSSKTADELNAIYGVTPDQAKALLASVMSEPEQSDAA